MACRSIFRDSPFEYWIELKFRSEIADVNRWRDRRRARMFTRLARARKLNTARGFSVATMDANHFAWNGMRMTPVVDPVFPAPRLVNGTDRSSGYAGSVPSSAT